MKASKFLVMSGILLCTGGLLTACTQSAQQAKTVTYSYGYAIDPDTLDYTLANRSSTSSVVANLVDGLLENDQYGNFVPSLAESWTVSQDGLTYTYKLRKGVHWYTADGEEYAEVKAQDFVTGLKHAADEKSDALDIVQDSIQGLDDYVKGVSNDFEQVGVKALDDYTVQYTLKQPESFWNSKTTLGVLFPVNEEFLKSKGKDFGTPKPENILYNGPFLLKNFTSKSVLEYAKNPNYWDKDQVKIDAIKLTYVDGSDPEGLIRTFTDGAFTTARVFPSSSNFASIKEQYKDNIVYTPQDATTYYYMFNLNRQKYEHTAKTTDSQKTATTEAVLNKNFRQAVNFSINRTTWSAQSSGEDGANKILRTSFVPDTFVQIGDKTFGQVAKENLISYGSQWQDVSYEDAQDSLYNPEKAKAAFGKAKEELQAKGVEFPIHLDLPVEQTDKLAVAQANSLKQSVEATIGVENVIVDVQQMPEDAKARATYQAPSPADKDYDLNMTGWSPDYQDPSSYLNVFDSESGSGLKHMGIVKGKDTEVMSKVDLQAYKALLDAAAKENVDLVKRYDLYAKAQAWLTDSSLALSMASAGGTPVVQRTVPFTGVYSLVGIKGFESFKGLEVQEDVVKTADYEKAREKWLEEKAKTNEQFQKELADHVK